MRAFARIGVKRVFCEFYFIINKINKSNGVIKSAGGCHKTFMTYIDKC
ncbi:Uncharacterised protein [Kluyvera intermedia]|nr:Uncharacterised protein [Kluyvera intermedia]